MKLTGCKAQGACNELSNKGTKEGEGTSQVKV